MESIFSLTCSDKTVFEFYNDHPNIDFQSMNVIFVNILKSLSNDMNSSFSTNIASQILSYIKEQTNYNRENNIILLNKLDDIKREYINDLKLIVSENTNNNIDNVISKHTSSLYDKMCIVIPKNNNTLKEDIRQSLETVKQESKHVTPETLNQFLSSTEDRLNKRFVEFREDIHNIKDISTLNQSSQISLNNNVSELLKKMENSSVKGKFSENILYSILQNLYSNGQIEQVGETKETGDIMLYRKNKPTILIENKNWNKNASKDEVIKFIRDVETQNCCGLFLSQNCGIANKDNFEININNGNILLYVHETNNDAEKIKIAIDIIDNFKIKLDEINLADSSGYNIDKECLDEINKEYQLFVSQRLNSIKTLTDFNQKMKKQLEEINLPSLDNYLSNKYAFSVTKIVCENCSFVAKNKQSLSSHKRYCGQKIDS
jgi:hypothetical protein